MMRFNRIYIGAALMLLLIPIGLNGQEYRSELKKSPIEVCKLFTERAEKGEFKDLEKELEPVMPVLESLKKRYGADIKADFETAVKNKDRKAVEQAAWKLAFFDMRELQDSIVEKKEGRSATLLKGWHKIAYLDYLYLSGEIAKREYKPEDKKEKPEKGTLIDSRIKRLFRSAYFALGKTNPYKKTETEADLVMYGKIKDAIANECLKAFPEFEVKKKEEKKTEAKK